MKKLGKIFITIKENKGFARRNIRWVTWIMAGVLLLLILVLALWSVSAGKTFAPGESTFRYCMGSRMEYSEDLELVYTDTGTVISDADEVVSDGTPIVYEGQQKMVIPVSMGYMRPFEEGGLNRVNYFSTLTMENGIARIERDGIVSEARGGFLYDGDGTYIFLENIEITVGNSSYRLKPLSYVKVFYRDSAEIYDASTGTYEYIALADTDAIAQAPAGYSLNLGTGVMTTGDSQRILFADIEAMGALR